MSGLRTKHLREAREALEQNERDRAELLGMIEFLSRDEEPFSDDGGVRTVEQWTGSKTDLFVKIINESPKPLRVREIITKASWYGITLDSPTAPNTVDGTIRPLTKGKNPRIALLRPGLYGSLKRK